MIKHYLKTAVRHMMKYKSQSAIAIIGLSLSLVCFSACLYICRTVLSVDANFPNRDRIVELKLWNTQTNGVSYNTPSREVTDALHQQGVNIPVVRSYFDRYESREYMVPVDDSRTLPYTLHCLEVDTLYNTFFTPHICYGSWAYTTSTRNALVLTKSVAERIFGDASRAVGLAFTLAHGLSNSPLTTPPAGGIVYTVTAVMEDLPLNTSINFMQEVEALTINDSEGALNGRADAYGIKAFALVPEGERRQDFIERFNQLQLKDRLGSPSRGDLKAFPLGYTLEQQSAAPVHARIALIAGLMVLLVGLLNFFYFLTESYRMRIREYFVRRVNGAGMLHLVGMLLTESAVYVGIVAFISIGLIKLMLNDYHLLLNHNTYIMNGDEVALQCGGYLLLLLILCAVVVGLLIIRLQHYPVSCGLTEARGRRGKHPLRNGLLAVQFVISWVFVGLTISLYQQSNYLKEELFGTLSVDEKERILSVSLDYRFLDGQKTEEAINRIRHCAGIEDFLFAPFEYVHMGLGYHTFYTDREQENTMSVQGTFIAPEFISFMHIPILQGEATTRPGQILADKDLSKELGGEALGRSLVSLDEEGYSIIGKIPTLFIDNYYFEEGKGLVLITNNFGQNHCYVKCRPGQTEQVRKEVDAVLRDILPESCEPQIRTFMEEIHDRYVLEFKLRNVVLFMAIVTLMIAILGIYSAITLDTERRQKEMVIRKINGAKVRHIAFLFARMYMVLLVGTAAIAFPLLHVIIKMLGEKYPLHVNTGWLFYTVLFICVALIVFLTIYRRIRNIAKVNPAEMIKSE